MNFSHLINLATLRDDIERYGLALRMNEKAIRRIAEELIDSETAHLEPYDNGFLITPLGTKVGDQPHVYLHWIPGTPPTIHSVWILCVSADGVDTPAE